MIGESQQDLRKFANGMWSVDSQHKLGDLWPIASQPRTAGGSRATANSVRQPPTKSLSVSSPGPTAQDLTQLLNLDLHG